MKKLLLIVIFSLLCACLCAADTEVYTEVTVIDTEKIYVSVEGERSIPSNGTKSLKVEIRNRQDIALHNVAVAVSNNGDLDITLDRTKIDVIEPNKTVTLNMEVKCNDSYYFSRNVTMLFEISSDGFTKENRSSFTIKPIENFWIIIIISVALLTITAFILLFIRINKGDNYA